MYMMKKIEKTKETIMYKYKHRKQNTNQIKNC